MPEIRLVNCAHIAGFHDAEGKLLDVPELRDEFTLKGRGLKRTHALDADGETYFLDAPEYRPHPNRVEAAVTEQANTPACPVGYPKPHDCVTEGCQESANTTTAGGSMTNDLADNTPAWQAFLAECKKDAHWSETRDEMGSQAHGYYGCVDEAMAVAAMAAVAADRAHLEARITQIPMTLPIYRYRSAVLAVLRDTP